MCGSPFSYEVAESRKLSNECPILFTAYILGGTGYARQGDLGFHPTVRRVRSEEAPSTPGTCGRRGGLRQLRSEYTLLFTWDHNQS